MPEHGHGHHHGPPDTSKGYEQSDLQISGIVKGVIAYFIFTAAVGVVVLLAMLGFHQTSPSKADFGPKITPPQPYPLLQNNVTARTDIWNLRSREQYLLDNVTYVDKAKGILRIPIEDAIDRAAAIGPHGSSATSSQPVPPPPAGVAGPKPQNSPFTRDPEPVPETGTRTIPITPTGHASEIAGGKK